MTELIPGKFHKVGGKGHRHLVGKDQSLAHSMYVRQERIEGVPWHVFATVWPNEILMRVRVPVASADMNDERVWGERGIVANTIISQEGDNHRSPSIRPFIDEAHRIAQELDQEDLADEEAKLLRVIDHYHKREHMYDPFETS